jgi:uncharacterized protein
MTKQMTNGEFCWNELMTPNPEAAKQFYSKLLGWEFETENINQESPYFMIKKGELPIGGMMQIPKDKENHIPPHWGSYIFVEDLKATVEKAKSLGAKIVVDITPVKDFGHFAVIQDPTGAYISFWHSVKRG